MALGGTVQMGLGEYLTLWVLILIIATGVLGLIMGAAAIGVVLFIVGGILLVLITYAILSRGWRYLLHGNPRGGE